MSLALKLSRSRLVAVAVVVPVAFIVLGAAAFAAISLQPHGNPSGQSSQNPNERCAPSPCGAPAGFEVDVTSVETQSNRLVLTMVFRNHTQRQMFEAVSYRHTSPADFTLRAGGRTLKPVFSADCPNWPEVDVNRGATSEPKRLCFAVTSPVGADLVWDPDLGFISEPVSIALG